MIFEWESEEERLLRIMKISPHKKMEWLLQMNEFIAKSMSDRDRKIRREIRENR